MSDKEYIVSISVSFDTPIDVKANSENAASKKAKKQFIKLFSEFGKSLNDIANLDIDVEYVECQED